VSRWILLDTGPLGMLARRKPDPSITLWMRVVTATGARLALPEIADYELRRELLRAGLTSSVAMLDGLAGLLNYLPITTPVMRQAAVFWADLRQHGRSTASPDALDGDVILAAQAHALIAAGHSVVVATANAGHLGRMIPAQQWDTITG
jgi:predicted nucleic acid-binding protein